MSQRSARRIRLENELRQLRAQVGQQPVEPQSLVQTKTAITDIVDRARDPKSMQPRFSSTSSDVFTSVYNWVHSFDNARPGKRASTRDWDGWYRRMSMREPFLTGVLNSVIQIDKNRGWTLIGGRNQVARYTKVLHDADNGEGWRYYCAWQASSYYQTRMGFVTELGKDGASGPLRALWSVDPTKCQLTGNAAKPLKYFPRSGAQQDWLPGEYFRNASMVSTAEEDLGLGFPAVARCLYLAEILVAVYEHDEEQLGARAPRGLLLLNGISQGQWDDAMKTRAENLDKLEREYYGGVAVLASQGVNEVTATLMALSQLPKDFDSRVFTDLAMYGFALAFGYDAREFYPVSSGSLGTATETEVQHQKASSKGDLDFSLAHQEKLQRQLPDSIQFEYEMRDDVGSQLAAAVDLAKAQVITEMTKWLVDSTSVLTKEQMLQMAADKGLIPEEWTDTPEEVTTTDTDETDLQQQARHNPHVMRAALLFPDEPILCYRYPANRVQVLFRRAGALLQPVYPVVSVITPGEHAAALLTARTVSVERATVSSVAATFQADLRGIVTTGFFSDSSILADVRALVRNGVGDAYVAGLDEGGVKFDEMDSDDAMLIVELTTEQLDHVTEFVRAVRDAREDKAAQRDILDNRIPLWTASITAAGQAGLASAKGNEMVRFGGEDGEESCKDCQRFKTNAHRRKWFLNRDYMPGKPGCALECKGYNCQHVLEPVK